MKFTFGSVSIHGFSFEGNSRFEKTSRNDGQRLNEFLNRRRSIIVIDRQFPFPFTLKLTSDFTPSV